MANVAQILGDIEMVENAEVEGGLVSARELPLDDARRLVRELEAAGYVADWTPSSRNDHSREQFAWLYVVAS